MNTSEYMLNIIHEIHSEYLWIHLSYRPLWALSTLSHCFDFDSSVSAPEGSAAFDFGAVALGSAYPFARVRWLRRLGPRPWDHGPRPIGRLLVPCSQTKDFQRLPTFIFSFCLGNFRLETIQIYSDIITFNGVIRFSGTWVQTRELSLQTARAKNILWLQNTTALSGSAISSLPFQRVPESYRHTGSQILADSWANKGSTMFHNAAWLLPSPSFGLCWALSGLTCPQRVHRAFMVKFFPPQGQIHPIQAFSALSLANAGVHVWGHAASRTNVAQNRLT